MKTEKLNHIFTATAMVILIVWISSKVYEMYLLRQENKAKIENLKLDNELLKLKIKNFER